MGCGGFRFLGCFIGNPLVVLSSYISNEVHVKGAAITYFCESMSHLPKQEIVSNSFL